MPTTVSDWSPIASNNREVGSINIAEGMAPGDINNAIREMMAQLRAEQTRLDGLISTFATNAEALAGTITDEYISPASLSHVLASTVTGARTHMFTTDATFIWPYENMDLMAILTSAGSGGGGGGAAASVGADGADGADGGSGERSRISQGAGHGTITSGINFGGGGGKGGAYESSITSRAILNGADGVTEGSGISHTAPGGLGGASTNVNSGSGGRGGDGFQSMFIGNLSNVILNRQLNIEVGQTLGAGGAGGVGRGAASGNVGLEGRGTGIVVIFPIPRA